MAERSNDVAGARRRSEGGLAGEHPEPSLPRPRGSDPTPREGRIRERHRDLNAVVAGLLFDLARIQVSRPSSLGYRGAARAIFELERPIDELLLERGDTLRIPRVGPASLRVVREVLETGGSERVEAAVRASPRAGEVARARMLRDGFLSRASVVAVLSDDGLEGPSRHDYRGDLQLHSTWSDGANSLDELAAACVERGYTHTAVSDHFALPIARGLGLDELAAQRIELETVNERFRGDGFRLLQAVEANILADGEIDLPLEARPSVDLVLAAPHSRLRSPEPQTSRLLAALEAPGVHVLAHPRGRMYGSRAGVQADWDAVFARAAELGVAVELDGDPHRQDLDAALARRALAAGCVFAVDSDAHATGELVHAETGLAHARLAGIPPERIVNCWPLDRLLRWAARRTCD